MPRHQKPKTYLFVRTCDRPRHARTRPTHRKEEMIAKTDEFEVECDEKVSEFRRK